MIDHNDTYGKEQAIMTFIRACTRGSMGAAMEDVLAKAKAIGFSDREYEMTLSRLIDKGLVYEPNLSNVKIIGN